MPAVTSTASLGQQAAEREFALTREQWQQRSEEARRRAERFVESSRADPQPPLPANGRLFPDSELTRKQWQARTVEARRQYEGFVASIGTPPSGASPSSESFADSKLTREQWLQRVENARRRSEEFVANARVEPTDPLSRDLQQREASERAMNDPTLQPGDIVSTDRGLVVFIGRDEERKPGDFRAAGGRISNSRDTGSPITARPAQTGRFTAAQTDWSRYGEASAGIGRYQPTFARACSQILVNIVSIA
jgi:hypothetical protein